MKKIIKRQQPYVYVNAKVKVHDLLEIITNKMDRYRVLVCIQSLMKKGQSEKAIKITREVVYNLFKEESERRSPLGGLFYIIDGIKRLEHAMGIMPIKKKGRVRYKRVKSLNQQKSIGKAVQLLIKFAQQKVFDTQQSYVTVLTQEFKELYKGISKLYKKNDEVYQEIITLRFRKKYHIDPAIYLARFRKKNDNYRRDKQTQEIIQLKRTHRLRKKYKRFKKLKYDIKINKILKQIKKTFKKQVRKKLALKKSSLIEKTKRTLYTKQLVTEKMKHTERSQVWLHIMQTAIGSGMFFFSSQNICTHIHKNKILLKNTIILFTNYINNQLQKDFLLVQGLKSLQNCMKVHIYITKQGSTDKQRFYAYVKSRVKAWFKNQIKVAEYKIPVYQINYKIKEVNFSLLDYIYILKYKYQKRLLYKFKFLKEHGTRMPLKRSTMFSKKHRITLYKHKKRGKKYPNDRLYAKEFLAQFMTTKSQKSKYATKTENDMHEQLEKLKRQRENIKNVSEI